ncbi:MAG: large repetitive protein, partial [Gaiellaceae bacterium]|nr:large repetitive protein [Gaiellaceae bacterium]
FTIKGTIKFKLQPSGRVDVNIPDASIGIKIPIGGTLTDAFSIQGSAQFAFGGGLGFQLQNLRVTGFSIMGVGISVPSALSSALLPPTAELISPSAGQNVRLEDLNARGYIDVQFNDVNGVGINAASITDATAEFLLLGKSAEDVTLTTVTQVAPTSNPGLFRYNFTGAFKEAGSTDPNNTVQVVFLPGSWSDARGTSNAASSFQFNLFDPPGDPNPVLATQAPVPVPQLASPLNASTVNLQLMRTRPYIDVTFAKGTLTGIDGDEIKLSGTGAANFDLTGGYITGTPAPVQLSPTTYRYYLTAKASADPSQLFVNGQVNVEFVARSWQVQVGTGPVQQGGVGYASFTVAGDAPGTTAGSGSAPVGPLTIEGPSIGLAGTSFEKGKLTLTIAIGANEASLNFGGGQGGSGVTAKLTGILGTFDVQVDVMKALSSISDPAGLINAFSVPGKFSLSIGTLLVDVPDVVRVTGSGIKIAYDPSYDPAKHGGKSQELVVVNAASIAFPLLGVEGLIEPFTDDKGTTTTTDDTRIPGLTVYSDGFQLGTAELIFRPGGPGAGSAIKLGSILLFDDLRIGVQNFGVKFGSSVDFNGNIFFASGGVHFLPGKPVSGELVDRLSAEPGDLPNHPDTEAVRATLEFENGHVKAFKFSADTLRVNFGSFLTLSATGFVIDTGAGPDDKLVSFQSASASVTIGSVSLTGEARDFWFNGDGSFHAGTNFGVSLAVGGANGESFKWPSWLPIHIDRIGIQWPDINADPGNFQLILTASVEAIKGIDGLQFSGSVDGIVIDTAKLFRGEFPIIDIAGIGVTLKGKVFGGDIDAALIGGILKIDANGRLIEVTDTITPVADRVFFVGVEGGFSMAGAAGFTIRFALSDLGPLSVFISASLPTGILLEPVTGLTINNFAGGVEFFHTLPSITNPFDLRGPAFALPSNVSASNWLATVKDQVVAQYLAIKANPSMNGWSAAFSAPMTITASARLYSTYTSQLMFNGDVAIKISTDGKILAVGVLNFAGGTISVSGRLYADLSHLDQGAATVLFLADVPDQVRVLTMYGKLQMGFRNPSGEEVAFTVVDLPPPDPTATLAGPQNEKPISLQELNGRAFVDVDFEMPTGQRLEGGSVTDSLPEFTITVSSGGTVTIDTTQQPLLMNAATNTYRYWVQARGDVSGNVELDALANSWIAKDTTTGALSVNPGTLHAHPHLTTGYVDVTLAPTVNQTVDESTVASADLQLRDSHGVIAASGDTPTHLPGTNVFRFYVDGTFSLGTVTATMAAGAWRDTAKPSVAMSGTFTVIAPQVTLGAPFGNSTTIDVGVVNADRDGASGPLYVDVTFTPTPGSVLDYASILDTDPEFSLTATVTGGTLALAQPLPINLVADPTTGVLTAQVVTTTDSVTGVVTTLTDPAQLAALGITRFRYRLVSGATTFAPGHVTITFDAGTWGDSQGNASVAQTFQLDIQGPTANVVLPQAGSGVDVNVLNGRNYLDVLFAAPPAGYVIDFSSITDLDPEFTLAGPGLGSMVIDASQAPAVVSASARRVRYWLNGEYTGGEVSLVFLPGTWAYIAAPGGATQGSTATVTFLSGAWSFLPTTSTPTFPTTSTFITAVTYPTGAAHGTIDVTLPAPDGFVVDPNSVGGNEITVGGGFTLNTTIAPTRIAGNTYRYTVDGTVNAPDQLVTVDDPGYVDVTIPTSQNGFVVDAGSITDTGAEFVLTFQQTISVLTTDHSISVKLPRGNYAVDSSSVTDAGAEFTMSGTALGSATAGTPTYDAINDRWIYPIGGSFSGTPIAIVVAFPGVVSGSQIDVASLAEFNEFTLGGTGLGSVAIDRTIAPVLIDASHVRYAITGSFGTSGDVTLTFTHGRWTTTPITGGTPTTDAGTATETVTLGAVDNPTQTFILVGGNVTLDFITASWTLTDTHATGSLVAPIDETTHTIDITLPAPDGATIDPGSVNGNELASRGTIDVTLVAPTGYHVDPNSVNGDEIVVSGGFRLYAAASPTRVSGNTFRFTVEGVPAAGATATVTLQPGTWTFLPDSGTSTTQPAFPPLTSPTSSPTVTFPYTFHTATPPVLVTGNTYRYAVDGTI